MKSKKNECCKRKEQLLRPIGCQGYEHSIINNTFLDTGN